MSPKRLTLGSVVAAIVVVLSSLALDCNGGGIDQGPNISPDTGAADTAAG